VADLGRGPEALINPEITDKSGETFVLWDDCMSFPGLLVRVRRHARISIAHSDESGKRMNLPDFDPARAELIQHEIDHLDGILAVDRALDGDSLVTRAAFEAHPEHFKNQPK
jgi:peptide deformylase